MALSRWSGALLGAILVSTTALADGEAGLHIVLIQGGEFRPQQIEIQRGDRVQWINRDYIPHTASPVTETTNWDSGNLNKDESNIIQFNESGSQDYFCRYHPSMTGIIIVKD